MTDIAKNLQEKIIDAHANKTALQIIGGNSKAFYGRTPSGKSLNVSHNTGIISYEPTELVITARGGTLLSDIEEVLAENNQMLAFEPPHFGDTATLGGTIACNFSGSRRPYAGAARDFVLGIKLLNGRGDILKFGGEVIKNVAGYDVSRLMCGALGTMGVLLEISLKVLPRNEKEITLVKELEEQAALDTIVRCSANAIPLSASLYNGNKLYLRLCGTSNSVTSAKQKIGGDQLDNSHSFWHKINEHRHPFFDSALPLWRLSLAPHTPPLQFEAKQLIDWGGAQRWLLSKEPAEKIRSTIQKMGGHAILFRNGDRQQDIFQPLQDKILNLHKNLKKSFDPNNIFNTGRMYKEF